jgi:hypothetical protein
MAIHRLRRDGAPASSPGGPVDRHEGAERPAVLVESRTKPGRMTIQTKRRGLGSGYTPMARLSAVNNVVVQNS